MAPRCGLAAVGVGLLLRAAAVSAFAPQKLAAGRSVVAAAEADGAAELLRGGLAEARQRADEEHETLYAPQSTKVQFKTWEGAAVEAPEIDLLTYDFKGAAPRPFSRGELCAQTREPVLTADECRALIDEAEARPGGWKAQSEFYYAKDVVQEVADLPASKAWFTAACRDRLFPLLQQAFPAVVGAGQAGRDRLRIQDAKVLKYNESAGQSYLGVHRDGTLLTFVVALNDVDDYTAGGTFIEELGAALRYGTGHVVAHPGIIRHGGQRVTGGVRYALACFVDVYGVVEHERVFLNVADRMRVRSVQERAGTEGAERWYAYSLAAEELPNTEQAWVGLAQCHVAKGQWPEAIAAYKEALAIEPKNGLAWTNFGSAIVERSRAEGAAPRTSDVAEAVVAFAKAAQLSDFETAPLTNLGLVLQETGKTEQAQQIFESAVARALKHNGAFSTPPADLAALYVNLGVAHYDAGDAHKAADAFDAALKYDPTSAAARQNADFIRDALRNQPAQPSS